MITITPAAQLSIIDSSTAPSTDIPVPPGGIPILCPAGALVQDATLAANTSNAALAVPVGVTTAKVLYILAVTLTDLVVTVGGANLAVPVGQVLTLYNVLMSSVSVSSVLGGKVIYAIGG